MEPLSSEPAHPAAGYASSIRTLSFRARASMVALGLTIGWRVYCITITAWQNELLGKIQAGVEVAKTTLRESDSCIEFGAEGQLVLLLITGFIFLSWLRRLTSLTRALSPGRLRWTPRQAVNAFIIPVINFKRPYDVMRDLHDLLTPGLLPEPPEQVSADEGMGYRALRVKAPPPPVRLPHAAIGAWWAAFWVGNFLSRVAASSHSTTVEGLLGANTLNMISDAVDMISAGLAIVMVRGMTARLLERFRRVRHNPVEVLEQAGLSMDVPESGEDAEGGHG